MPRKTSRRLLYSKQDDESVSKEQGRQDVEQNERGARSSKEDEHQGHDANDLIADMAQGFIQAQAKMTDTTSGVSNLEFALLMQKVNDQLEEIKRATSNSGQTSQQKVSPSQPPPAADLQSLLQSMLQGNSQQETGDKQSTSKQKSTEDEPQQGNTQPNKMVVQTMSQALAQAQYDLADELETSLKKLKQVIKESEKIANNISTLLGEEGKKKS